MDWPELPAKLAALDSKISNLNEILDMPALKATEAKLESETLDPTLWSDQDNARKVSSALSHVRSQIRDIETLNSDLGDLKAAAELGAESGDAELMTEALQKLQGIEKRVAAIELSTLLSGEYDSRGAVITIRSGAGGDDATDFAEMLLRMYLRYAEQQGFKTQVLDVSYAEGAGIKSATFEVDAPFAYGNLSVESGTHRLVRMSPFNAAGKRQTSFAAVEVVPLVETTDAVEVAESDIRVDVFRSSGPGGQSVNTTDSAVRITHIPSGIVVSCQNEKSQLQNKAAALRVLQSRLLEIKRQQEEANKKQLAGDVKASWGEQMRSYVLAPYQMVKDLRTGFEVNNPADVFDGDISGFIAAGIRWRKQSQQ